MVEMTETARVRADAERLWAEAGGFRGVGAWHPMLARLESEGEERSGALRTAHAKDGSTQVERLLEIDPTRHAYRYTIVSTPMPLRDYLAEFRITDQGDGTSSVRWSARFEVTGSDEATTAEAIRGFLRAGLERLQAMYG